MLALLAVASLYPLTASAAFCYSHDGIEATQSEFWAGDALTSCRQGDSTCCLPGESCGEDLLCHNSAGDVSRQYCTDPSWPAEHCSQLCPEYNAAGVILTRCEENVYCCGADYFECCEAGNGTRIDERGQIVAIGSSTVDPPQTRTTERSESETGTTATSTRTRTRSTTGNSESHTQPPNSDPTDPSNSPSGGNSSPGLSAGAGAGIGVGAAAAVAIFCALVWFVLRERRKRKALEASMSPLMAAPYVMQMEDRKSQFSSAQEMDGDGMPSEVDARSSALAELETGYNR